MSHLFSSRNCLASWAWVTSMPPFGWAMLGRGGSEVNAIVRRVNAIVGVREMRGDNGPAVATAQTVLCRSGSGAGAAHARWGSCVMDELATRAFQSLHTAKGCTTLCANRSCQPWFWEWAGLRLQVARFR
jgi:hypothetical protein